MIVLFRRNSVNLLVLNRFCKTGIIGCIEQMIKKALLG